MSKLVLRPIKGATTDNLSGYTPQDAVLDFVSGKPFAVAYKPTGLNQMAEDPELRAIHERLFAQYNSGDRAVFVIGMLEQAIRNGFHTVVFNCGPQSHTITLVKEGKRTSSLQNLKTYGGSGVTGNHASFLMPSSAFFISDVVTSIETPRYRRYQSEPLHDDSRADVQERKLAPRTPPSIDLDDDMTKRVVLSELPALLPEAFEIAVHVPTKDEVKRFYKDGKNHVFLAQLLKGKDADVHHFNAFVNWLGVKGEVDRGEFFRLADSRNG